MRLTILPRWVLTSRRPAFYDTESLSAIEMVAKLYGAMRELQEDYNSYTEELTKTINDFTDKMNTDMNCFKSHIDEVMHDYIEMIDEKIKVQDSVIADAVKYMKDNLSETAVNIITEMSKTGEIVGTLNTNYDEDTESLSIDTITFSFVGGEE